jgi:hypothetical protein
MVFVIAVLSGCPTIGIRSGHIKTKNGTTVELKSGDILWSDVHVKYYGDGTIYRIDYDQLDEVVIKIK